MEGMEELELSKAFDRSLEEGSLYPLTALKIETLQVNVGRLCNLSCRHCHVEAGPGRTEVMNRGVMEECLKAARTGRIPAVDITGGAPEMNPDYRWFVESLREAGLRVMTRTNLVILVEEGYKDLPELLARNRVEVVASLPYYSKSSTDRLRGSGVFDASIEALKRLNAAGYGLEGSGLVLNLVYNPCGAFLPPSQKSLEADFRRELKRSFGVSFSGLFAITNMPVGRFLRFLKDSGNAGRYLERLVSAYNPAAAGNAMCRKLISVGWDGTLYDCDFNQMLGLKCGWDVPSHIRDFDAEKLSRRRIVTGPHCYGCTAGHGSSCTGEVSRC